jgi:outer membrane protein assembly factor BamD (BamD/ComL family)
MKNIVAIMSLLALFGACSSAPEKLDDRRASINEEYQEDLAELKEEREENLKQAEEDYREDVRDYRRERAHEAIDDSENVDYDKDGNVINLEN